MIGLTNSARISQSMSWTVGSSRTRRKRNRVFLHRHHFPFQLVRSIGSVQSLLLGFLLSSILVLIFGESDGSFWWISYAPCSWDNEIGTESFSCDKFWSGRMFGEILMRAIKFMDAKKMKRKKDRYVLFKHVSWITLILHSSYSTMRGQCPKDKLGKQRRLWAN